MEPTLALDRRRSSATRPDVAEANKRALKAGYNFGETTEMFHTPLPGPAGAAAPGHYRNITGNEATALGFVAAAKLAERQLFYGSYPITPASDILHELSSYKNFGVKTFQAEDEIAAIGAAIGASYGGALGADRHAARASRSRGGDRPRRDDRAAARRHRRPARRPVDRPADEDRAGRPAPGDVRPQRRVPRCRSSRRRRRPMLRDRDRGVPARAQVHDAGGLLSDGYLANGAEPWRVPTLDDLPDISVANAAKARGPVPALPARPRDARPPVGRARHARPRAPHRRPREGRRPGQRQLRPRQPPADDSCSAGPEDRRDRRTTSRRSTCSGRRRASCWSSAGAAPTARSGARSSACTPRAAASPTPTSATSTRSRPTPATLLRRYQTVLVPELNLGQLAFLLRGTYLVDAVGYNRCRASRSASRRSSTRPCASSTSAGRTDDDRPDSRPPPRSPATAADHSSPARTSCPTRRSAGAPAAATTRSSPRSRRCCPTSASRRRTSCSSRASAAPAGSRTT